MRLNRGVQAYDWETDRAGAFRASRDQRFL